MQPNQLGQKAFSDEGHGVQVETHCECDEEPWWITLRQTRQCLQRLTVYNAFRRPWFIFEDTTVTANIKEADLVEF